MDPDDPSYDDILWDDKEYKAMQELLDLRPYAPPEMRINLIKELYESLGFGHPGVKEMI